MNTILINKLVEKQSLVLSWVSGSGQGDRGILTEIRPWSVFHGWERETKKQWLDRLHKSHKTVNDSSRLQTPFKSVWAAWVIQDYFLGFWDNEKPQRQTVAENKKENLKTGWHIALMTTGTILQHDHSLHVKPAKNRTMKETGWEKAKK